MYNFNLLVSCPWALAGRARREIDYLVKQLGDDEPVIKPTKARGIMGVKTHLDSREVIKDLKTLFEKDPNIFQFTLKWVPVDLWVDSDIEAMKEAVAQIKDKIKLGERCRMTVENGAATYITQLISSKHWLSSLTKKWTSRIQTRSFA
jgi:tRNA(Ser,Leu) C12 N-acetylase TAN1